MASRNPRLAARPTVSPKPFARSHPVLVPCGWLVAYRAARSGARAARRDSKGGAPPHSAGFSAKADSNRSREAARLGRVESAAPPTPPWSEQSSTSSLEPRGLGCWSCGPSGEGPLPKCPAGPPLFRPQRRTGGELNPTWSELRKLESTWSRAQNLESALKTWSELAPSWSEVGASGASEKKFSNVGPLGPAGRKQNASLVKVTSKTDRNTCTLIKARRSTSTVIRR